MYNQYPLVICKLWLILSLHMSAFEYVVQRKAKQHVSFWTTRERDVSLICPKFNRTSVSHTREFFPNISPCSYFVEKEKKVPQPGLLGTVASRFKRAIVEGPSPATYELHCFPSPIPKSKAPFNNSTLRDEPPSKRSNTPGPGTYNPRDGFVHKLNYYQNFGRRRIKVQAPEKVEDLHNKCGVCGTLPIAAGKPFWKKIIKDEDAVDVMCCVCMKNLQKEAPNNLKKNALMKKYRLKCECPYYHRHAGMPNYRVITPQDKANELPKEARFDHYLHTVKEEEKDESVEGFTREIFGLILEDMLVGVPLEELSDSIDLPM